MEQREAERVMKLAEESNAMLKNTMAVFGQVVYAAEYWFAGKNETH